MVLRDHVLRARLAEDRMAAARARADRRRRSRSLRQHERVLEPLRLTVRRRRSDGLERAA